MKKRRFLLLALTLIAALLLTSTAASALAFVRTEINAEKAALVRVFAEFENGVCASGSAFAVGEAGRAPEYFLTNAHLLLDENGVPARRVSILTDSRAARIVRTVEEDRPVTRMDEVDYARTIGCTVLSLEAPGPDLALLRSASPIAGRSPLPLHVSSAGLKDGSTVYALGFPDAAEEGSSYLAALPEEAVISSGTSSRSMGGDAIFHSAAVSRGSTGGALVDEYGAVLGICSDAPAGMSGQFLAVPIEAAVGVLNAHQVPFINTDALAETVHLIALIVLVATVVLAAMLILFFLNKGRQYAASQQKAEARELRVQGVSGVFAGRRFPIARQVSFGRATDNSIVFPTNTKSVSAHHCVLLLDGGRLYLKDVGSSFGTSVNGSQRIPPNELVSLKVGDTFCLGSEHEVFQITFKGGRLTLP